MTELATRYGPLSVPDGDDLIGRMLAHAGEWGQDEVRFCAAALGGRVARVCDLGAFVGTFGLGLGLETPLAGVVFVEANPLVTPHLRRNAALATVPAMVVEALVAPAGFDGGGAYTAGNLGSHSFAYPAADRIAAPPPAARMTLAALRAAHGPFDLIKIDAEGLELAILRDDPAALADRSIAWWLEANEAPETLDVADLMLAAGMSVACLGFPAQPPAVFSGATTPLMGFAYEAGLWACHGALPALPEALRDRCFLHPVRDREALRRALWRIPHWGEPDWHGAGPAELVAIAAHATRGELYRDFLTGLPPHPPDCVAWQRELEATRLLLAAERRPMDALRVRAEAAEDLAAMRLAQAERATRRADAAEAWFARPWPMRMLRRFKAPEFD